MAGRIIPVVAMGVAAVFLIVFLLQSLLSLSAALNEATNTLNSLESRLATRQTSESALKNYYEDRYLAKARVLAYIL